MPIAGVNPGEKQLARVLMLQYTYSHLETQEQLSVPCAVLLLGEDGFVDLVEQPLAMALRILALLQRIVDRLQREERRFDLVGEILRKETFADVAALPLAVLHLRKDQQG